MWRVAGLRFFWGVGCGGHGRCGVGDMEGGGKCGMTLGLGWHTPYYTPPLGLHIAA